MFTRDNIVFGVVLGSLVIIFGSVIFGLIALENSFEAQHQSNLRINNILDERADILKRQNALIFGYDDSNRISKDCWYKHDEGDWGLKDLYYGENCPRNSNMTFYTKMVFINETLTDEEMKDWFDFAKDNSPKESAESK